MSISASLFLIILKVTGTGTIIEVHSYSRKMKRLIETIIFCCIIYCFIISNVDSLRLRKLSHTHLNKHNRINQDNTLSHKTHRPIIDSLTIKIKDNNDRFIIELEKVDHYLANIHLPIWKTSSEYPDDYQKLHNIMHKVGNFTMYRDYKSNSALVYFHERNELDGVINRRFYIRKLPLNKLHHVHEVDDKYVFLQGHDFYRDNEIVHSERKGVHEKGKKIHSRKSRGLVSKVYPELLIAIGYDMFIAIEQHSKLPFGVSVVSHILVVFNAVDMLYHSVKAREIRLNIAGIILETSEDHWGIVKSLAIGESIEQGIHVKSILDGENITSIISDHFIQMEKYFPRDSYDFILYNTRNQLTYSSVNVIGMAWHAGFSYMYPAGQYYDRINVAIQDHKSWAHFVVIAHEIAHMMNVEHDPTNDILETDTIRGSLMSCYKGQCVHDLSWSEASEEMFQKYFSSPAHCILINLPRSLHPPKPRKTVTVLEQCQCNGFDTYKKPNPGDECNEPNICLNNNETNLIHVTQLPMDGTPCGNYSWNYICWEQKCIQPDQWTPQLS